MHLFQAHGALFYTGPSAFAQHLAYYRAAESQAHNRLHGLPWGLTQSLHHTVLSVNRVGSTDKLP